METREPAEVECEGGPKQNAGPKASSGSGNRTTASARYAHQTGGGAQEVTIRKQRDARESRSSRKRDRKGAQGEHRAVVTLVGGPRGLLPRLLQGLLFLLLLLRLGLQLRRTQLRSQTGRYRGQRRELPRGGHRYRSSPISRRRAGSIRRRHATIGVLGLAASRRAS